MFYNTMCKKTAFNETCLNWCKQGITLVELLECLKSIAKSTKLLNYDSGAHDTCTAIEVYRRRVI